MSENEKDSMETETEFQRMIGLPCAQVKNSKQFEQSFVDNIYQLVQVIGMLHKSDWFKWKLHYNSPAFDKNMADMPPVEYTVFALTYIRQLIGGDDLFRKACQTYMRFSTNEDKKAYIKEQKDSFNKYLSSSYGILTKELSDIVDSVEDLFRIMAYGTLIIHGPSKSDSKLQDKYKLLAQHKDRVRFLWDFNFMMINIVITVGNAFFIIYQDVQGWVDKGLIPKPNIFYQFNFFSWKPIEK